ncbi:hypothetical protein [Bradyrhizobium monzae]|uniref:hypothetical protein n=1 Tax=Bradyrhizobium sp. Oc8 TaxID=2876780 RepID=UPI001F2639B4|nr:hypothetical protein [Bradyrhizobium sp. Oc8]
MGAGAHSRRLAWGGTNYVHPLSGIPIMLTGQYGKGARNTARLVIEMRQGADETPEPWDRGDI